MGRKSEARRRDDDIAIIGMSGRFPGATNLSEFWNNLRDGVESITSFTDSELTSAGVDPGVEPAALDEPSFVPAGSIIEGVDLFDANFFGYSPREAESLDPQQRLFLETAWHALENAGYDPHSFPGLIGVYGGCAMSTYLRLLESNPDIMRLLGYLQVYIGNDKDYLTTHVSYKLDLRGPSFSIQTACSTSLVTVAVAADHLLSHQCDMALAGGVCIRVPQEVGYYYEPGGIFSPDGHCRVFDEQAAGVVFGNGVGIVVLKRLSDALADGDAIDAVVKGWAVNNDGSAKASFAAPSVDGQLAVIRAAHESARISPSTITYVEAHGTGTPLGDPIEIEALTKAFAESRRKQFCAVGSVKTNVGHLDPAAGVASLIKTVLALQHRELPPSLHYHNPNPRIGFADSPFFVNDRLTRSRRVRGTPRRAGVSGFGIGGTNVHLVLEEAPQRSTEPDSRLHHLLVLSARNRPALETMVSNLVQHIEAHPELPAGDVAYTSQVGRRALNSRLALICGDTTDLVDALRTRDPRRLLEPPSAARSRAIAFMFSGQGSQYVHMGRGLYDDEPVFRNAIDLCADVLRPHLGLDLRRLIYPQSTDDEAEAERLTRTEFTQPALFVVEYALAQLWAHVGVRPQAMIGHSIGEYVAACLAGVLTLTDALALVAIRGRTMQQLPPGSMLSVPLASSELEPLLDEHLDLAASNEPELCVVSGPTEHIARLKDQLAARGVEPRVLHTSHAFHSRMMEPLMDEFTKAVSTVPLHAPEIAYLSNVTGDWITDIEATDPGYWAQHLRRPVRWMDGLGRLLEAPDRVLLEVGPGQALCTFARHHPNRAPDQSVIPSLRHPQDPASDALFWLESVARLWLSGERIEWAGLHDGDRRSRVHLPGYPFERQRYWIDDLELGAGIPAVIEKQADIANWFYLPSWDYSISPENATVESLPTRWLVFDDGSPLGKAVLDRLAARGENVTTVSRGIGFAADRDGAYAIDPGRPDDYADLIDALAAQDRLPEHVLHLWAVGPPQGEQSDADVFDRHQTAGFYSVLYVVQALVKAQVNDWVHIVVASSELHAVTGEEQLCPAKATLGGVCHAVPQEYPNLVCRSVDIEHPRDGAVEEVAAQLIAEFSDGDLAPTVAYRAEQRWVQVFEPLRLEEESGPTLMLRRRGIYLVTGGLGNVGLALASHLASWQARLVLVGRSTFIPREGWDDWIASHEPDDPTSGKIRQLQYIEQQGAEVLVVSADVSDVAQLRRVLAQTSERFGRLNGVIHAAGNVTASGFFGIDEGDVGRCEQQFQGKVRGVLALEEVLREEPLDFVVLVSSISSVLAGLGYIAYAAANMYLDAFAQKYSQTTGVPWVSIDWETWEFGDGVEIDSTQLAMYPEEGLEAFSRIVGSAMLPQVVVSAGDLQARIDRWVTLTSKRGFEEASDRPSHLHSRPDISTPYIAPRTALEESISEIWQETLGVAEVGIFDNFFTDLGGSSLVATRVIARLRERFSAELPLRLLFDGPTVADIAAVIASQEDASVERSTPTDLVAEGTSS